MRFRTVCVRLGVLSAVFLSPWSAMAVTLYVRQSGSDANSGASEAAAFRTIQRAINACTGTAGGYTIYVGPGTYAEEVNIGIGDGTAARSGVLASPNKLIGDPSGIRTGDPAGVVLISGGSTRNYGIQLNNRDYWECCNFRTEGQTRQGFRITQATGVRISGCTIVPPSQWGICAQADDIVIEQNTFVRSATSGSCVYVYALDSGSITIRRNRFTLLGPLYLSKYFATSGIGADDDESDDESDADELVEFARDLRKLSTALTKEHKAPGWLRRFTAGIVAVGKKNQPNSITIENNVGSDCYLGIYAAVYHDAAARISIASNTITGCVFPLYCYTVSAGSGSMVNNIIANSYYSIAANAPSVSVNGLLSHDISLPGGQLPVLRSSAGLRSGDPCFVAPASGNFAVGPGSPAIDTGAIDGAPSVDLAGGLRPFDGDHDGVPLPDLGACEFGSGKMRLVRWKPRDQRLVTRNKLPGVAPIKTGISRITGALSNLR